MTREELLEVLKESLEVRVDVSKISSGYDSEEAYHKIEVSLLFDGEEISSSYDYT